MPLQSAIPSAIAITMVTLESAMTITSIVSTITATIALTNIPYTPNPKPLNPAMFATARCRRSAQGAGGRDGEEGERGMDAWPRPTLVV